MLNKFKRFYSIDQSEIITPPNPCYSYEVTVLVEENIVFTYTPCVGSPTTITLNGDGITNPRIATLCCSTGPSTTANPSKYDIFIGDSCFVGA